MSRPVNPSERIQWFYNTYPANFKNFSVDADAAKEESIHIPRAEFEKLMKLSDYFYAMFEEEDIPEEGYELTRYQVGVSREVFHWIPWVFNYYGIRVDDPMGMNYNVNQVLLVRSKNIIRFLVDYFGFPEEPMANVYRMPRPRPIKNRTIRRRNYKNYSSNNSNNKASRKANKKRTERMNIRGMHPLEAKYY